ncbi:Flp family type IVb pilin [uncultured Sphingomonas sp.]|uniref:Flp family type IVb pilin n=1 Tax=uncultured Sphingomonas sp. TaxID=158754 RepID=UPI0035CBA941
MRHGLPFLRRLAGNQRGATAVEYGLILAGIVLAMFGALQTLGNTTTSMWNDVSTKVTAAH